MIAGFRVQSADRYTTRPVERGCVFCECLDEKHVAAVQVAVPGSSSIAVAHVKVIIQKISSSAEWRCGSRVGLITQRAVDRNHAPLFGEDRL